MAAAAALALVIAVALPGARRLLHFGVPNGAELALSIALVAFAVLLGAVATLRARRSDVRVPVRLA